MFKPWSVGKWTIQMEPVGPALAAEIDPLLHAHAAETLGRPLKAEYEYYLKRAREGRFAMIVVREGKTTPVGFLGFRIDTSPYEGHTVVAEELFYLSPAVRGTTLALKTIKYFVHIGRWLGARELYMGYTARDCSALYRRAGLREVSVLYGMELREDEDSQEPGLRTDRQGTGRSEPRDCAV